MKTFYLSDLDCFCDEYEIDAKVINFYKKGIIIPFSDILFAFRCFVDNDTNAITEYFKILDIIADISFIKNIRKDIFDQYVYSCNFDIESFYKNLAYILSYKGAWDIDNLLNRFNLSKQVLLRDLDQFANKFNVDKQSIKKENKIERDISDKTSQKLIFKKAGKRGCREVNLEEILEGVLELEIYSELFKLYKKTGRPTTILHEWIFEEQCKMSNVNLNNIMNFTEVTRKEILDELFGKEYIEEKSWKILINEVRRRNIPTPYGDIY